MLLLYIISTHTEEEMEELDNEMIVAKAKQKKSNILGCGRYLHTQQANMSVICFGLYFHTLPPPILFYPKISQWQPPPPAPPSICHVAPLACGSPGLPGRRHRGGPANRPPPPSSSSS